MRSNPLTKEESPRELFDRAKNGDVEVRNRIVSENLGLVYLVLKRFAGRGYEMEDLFQIGSIGLLKAAERFDPELDYAFSTYAVPMIMGEVRRFLRDDGMLHISRRKKEQAAKIAAVRDRIKKETGHEPTLAQLEKETGFSREEIVDDMEFYPVVESLSRPIGADSDSGTSNALTLMDQLQDEHCAENEILNKIALEQLLAQLAENEKKLLRLRYIEGKTQSETGTALGMNQVAVSRLEKKILLQLRANMGYNVREGKSEHRTIRAFVFATRS